MSERKTHTFSVDAPMCKKCPEYNNCNNKRMAFCKYLEPTSAEALQPVIEDMVVKHDYGNIKIAPNTTVTIDSEELKKKLTEDIYKGLNCNFLSFGG